MKNLLLIGLLGVIMMGCDRKPALENDLPVAQIVGYDLNCNTCTLSFPNDSLAVKKLLGASPKNYYQAINLNKNSYAIGQMLRLSVRRAMDSELMPCITLYPSVNYQPVVVSDVHPYSDFPFGDTLTLSIGNCIRDFDKNVTICFDGVVSDSRCPDDALCFMAGEAIVRLKISRDKAIPLYIDISRRNANKTILGYQISLFDVLPHPLLSMTIKQSDYKIRIIVRRTI